MIDLRESRVPLLLIEEAEQSCYTGAYTDDPIMLEYDPPIQTLVESRAHIYDIDGRAKSCIMDLNDEMDGVYDNVVRDLVLYARGSRPVPSMISASREFCDSLEGAESNLRSEIPPNMDLRSTKKDPCIMYAHRCHTTIWLQ